MRVTSVRARAKVKITGDARHSGPLRSLEPGIRIRVRFTALDSSRTIFIPRVRAHTHSLIHIFTSRIAVGVPDRIAFLVAGLAVPTAVYFFYVTQRGWIIFMRRERREEGVDSGRSDKRRGRGGGGKGGGVEEGKRVRTQVTACKCVVSKRVTRTRTETCIKL